MYIFSYLPALTTVNILMYLLHSIFKKENITETVEAPRQAFLPHLPPPSTSSPFLKLLLILPIQVPGLSLPTYS